MECTYCGFELNIVDYYGRILAHQDGKKLGDILKCPNHEGFDSKEDALIYMNECNSLNNIHDADFDWREIVCDSSCHHVSGSFYTDEQGNLHEGYPC
jgi:hypothetical protein